MQNVESQNTRNFALIGHAGDGKTSVGEALLHAAGATHELGKVDEGTSALNYLPEEQDGHIASISAHIYSFDWNDNHLTLVDTPGDRNFQGDGMVALQALDGAVLVLSAVDGVKAGSEKMLSAARESNVSVLAFVNGIDRERANFAGAIESMSGLGLSPAIVTFPMGESESLSGIIDVLHMKAVTAAGTVDIPEEYADETASRREQLAEAVAESDDALLEKYLEEGQLSEEEIRVGLVQGAKNGQLMPVLCGSASEEVGIELLLRDLMELLPSPLERGDWPAANVTDGEAAPVSASPDAVFSGVVMKTIIDRYAGTLSALRVVSGTLKPDTGILNVTADEKVRVAKLFTLQGDKHEAVPEAGPGDIVAVAKLKNTHTGNVLTTEKGGVRLEELNVPQGVISYAIEAATQKDEDKVFTSLHRLGEEDPSLHVGREATTGEFLLTGMGELHIRTTVKKLARMFDVKVNLKTQSVPYRETITKAVQHVEGKLKKQSGGAGMFGVCYLDLEPLPRESGVEFEDKITQGKIPKGLIPAVQKGVLEACERGPLAGYPIVDVKIRCVDGKYHDVDSNEMAFKLAGSFGMKTAVSEARPVLLEPYMKAEISVPDESVGDIMGDISSRRGVVQTTETRGNSNVVIAKVPMAEMLEYASILTSLTGGKGEFHLELSHYDVVPSKLSEKIVQESKAAESEKH
ncbi:MAG: elongation factor G [Myxococcota bacterium]|nr:elongation factor G [Myxococcota bacterium]